MTGREGGNEDICLGAFDRTVMHTGIDSLQNIVGTQLEGTDVVIGQEAEQMRWIFDGDNGGFIDTFTKFASETAKKKES